jgi:2,3-bisphosphoglycerate-dependent phosphoglycerate mutase
VTATRLVLTRHGQSVWHEENRYAGTSDIGLTDVGLAQADRLAAWARAHRPVAVVSSPLGRALATAGPSARALDLTPVVVDDLREVDFGLAEGRTLSELRADDPDMVDRFRRDPVTHHFPGADPPAAAAKRAGEALRDVAAGHPGATVLVVAHNTILRLALCHLLGIDVRTYRQVFPLLDNGTLTELALGPAPGPASLLSFNVPLGS